MANFSLTREESGERDFLLTDPARRRLSVLNDIVPLIAGSASASFVSKGSSPGLAHDRVSDAVLLTEYVITGNHPAIKDDPTECDVAEEAKDRPVEGGAEEVKEDSDDILDIW